MINFVSVCQILFTSSSIRDVRSAKSFFLLQIGLLMIRRLVP